MLVVVCEDAVSSTEDVSLDLFIVSTLFLCPTVVLMYNFSTMSVVYRFSTDCNNVLWELYF
jgi:hypothetical protein